MAKISDTIKFNLKMSELASKEYNSVLKNIQPALLQYREALSRLSTPAVELARTTIPTSLQLLIDKMNEMQQLYEPIMNFELFQINELTPKFNILLDELSVALEEIDCDECSDEEIENISLSIKSVEEIKDTVKTRKLSVGEWLIIIELIVTIFFGTLSLMPNSQLEQLHQDNVLKNQYLKQFTEDFHDFSEALQKHLETTQTLSVDTHTSNLTSDSEVE